MERRSILGLTGKICAGKNLAAKVLADKGYYIIDVDAVGHTVIERESDELVRLFGRSVLNSDGQVDRKALGNLVFGDREALKKLEEFLHPLMKQECLSIIEDVSVRRHYRGIVLNAAILTRMGLDELCDAVIFVTAGRRVRRQRAMRERGMKRREFRHRDAQQRDIQPSAVRSGVSVMTASNNGTRGKFAEQLDSLVDMMDIVIRQG